jgi:hypothetical protein
MSHYPLIAGFIVFFILLVIAIVVLIIVSEWKIYEKAGVPGWSVLIPFYNLVKLLQITRRPLWWILMMCIPLLNIIIGIILVRRLAAVFGKGVGFTWGLVLLPFIFYPILAYGDSKYANDFPPASPMSEAVKWTFIAAAFFMLAQVFFGASFMSHPSQGGDQHRPVVY